MPVESPVPACDQSEQWNQRDSEDRSVPSLLRVLAVIAVLAGLGYAGIWALATMVQPVTRDATFTVPNDRYAK